MIFHEFLVKICISVGRAVRCDQKLCIFKIRCIDRNQFDLYRPLGKTAYLFSYIPGNFFLLCLHRRFLFLFQTSCHTSGTHVWHPFWHRNLCFLKLHSFFHCLRIIICGFPLYNTDRIGRAGRKTVSQSVTVIIPYQFRLAIYHGNSPFVAGSCTGTAAVAFLFLNVYDLSYHDIISP